MHTLSGRVSALIATGALVAGGAGLALTAGQSASAAEATAVGPKADAGATWLKNELTNGLMYNPNYGGFDDYGLSADTAFALDAVGGHTGTVVQIADAVAAHVTDWYDYYGTIYTGSAAKAMVLAQTAGQDPTSYGGEDLQDVVESHVATAAPIVGRVQNEGETDWQPPYDPIDSVNVISQAWAARGLIDQGSSLSDEVLDFLLEQQCSAGFFRPSLNPDKTAANQSCDTASPAAEVPSADTTALVVILLADVPEAATAVDKATAWLLSQQAADGSFPDGDFGPNANGTGLAGWALGEAGEQDAATKAARWIAALQVPAGAADAGAIAYDADALAGIPATGIDDLDIDQWRRASAQALPALLSFQAPTPTPTPTPTTTVTPTPTTTVTTTVTPTPTLAPEPSLKAPKKATAGKKLKVKVTGLEAGETVTVKLRGKKVAKANADTAGVVKAKIALTGKKLSKPGTAKLVVISKTGGKLFTQKLKIVA